MLLIMMAMIKMLTALTSQRIERFNFNFLKWGPTAEERGPDFVSNQIFSMFLLMFSMMK